MFIRNGALAIISKIKDLAKKLRSFRLLLFILIVIIGIVTVILFKEIMFASYRIRMINQRTTEIKYAVSALSNQLSTGDSLEGSLAERIVNAEINWVSENYGGRIVIVNDSYRVISDTYEWDVKKTCISQEVFQAFQGESYFRENKEQGFIEFTLPISTKVGDNTQIVGVMLASASIFGVDEIMRELRDKAFVLEIVFTIILAIIAFVLSYFCMKPWKRVVSVFDQVKDGNLNIEISNNKRNYTETSEILDAFDHLLKRLSTIDKSRQEFVSNVSHELKTPITSIRVLADSLLCEENAPVELYREFLGDISDEIDRETKIINDLLSMVKLEKDTAELNVAQININDLIKVILKRLSPIAKQRNIELVFESFRPVIAEVDETKLSLAINNLVENAIKYNNDDGWVRVSLNADHKFFFLKVMDSGVGIPEDALPHIFDRFYRVDKARSRETGGTGLGLAITINVIQLHGGWIKAESNLGEGTTFSVRIPLTYVAQEVKM